MNQELSMNAKKLVAFLQKPTSEFTKADIISFIQQNDIRMVNFMYPAGDGRLKTLNFVINNQAYLEAILPVENGWTVPAFSLLSKREVVIFMLFLGFVQHLLIRLLKYLRCLSFVLSSIRMENRWEVHRNIRFIKRAKHLRT